MIDMSKMHPDFKRILDDFINHFAKLGKDGAKMFSAWLSKMGIDPSKPYGATRMQREFLAESLHSESFRWAQPLIQLLKADDESKTYKVWAHYALKSMNDVIYTEDEILRAVSSLPDKPIDLNHNREWTIEGAQIVAANWEDYAVEALIRVMNGTKDAKGRDVQKCCEDGTYHSVSIEGNSEDVYVYANGDIEPVGLKYTGLAFLDADELAGIPLTRIEPLEKIVERIYEQLERVGRVKTQDSEVNEKMSDEDKNQVGEPFPPVPPKKKPDPNDPNQQPPAPPQQPQPQQPQQPQQPPVQQPKEAGFCPMCGNALEGGTCINAGCHGYGKKVQMSAELLLADANAKLAEQSRKMAEMLETAKLQSERIAELEGRVGKERNSHREALGRIVELEKAIRDRDKRIRQLDDDNDKLREDIGQLTQQREQAIGDMNEALSKAASAITKANSETDARARLQRENADLREKLTKAIREGAETSEQLNEQSKRNLQIEDEFKGYRNEMAQRDLQHAEEIRVLKSDYQKVIDELKTEIGKRDEAIKDMKGKLDVVERENKRIHNTMQKEGLYEVTIDKDGNVKLV